MNAGKAYVWLRALGIALPLLAGLAALGVKVLRGNGTLHVYAPPGAALTVTVDGARLELAPANVWHRTAEIGDGKHHVVLEEDGQTQAWTIDVGGLDHLLLPRSGQCFVWWTWTGPRLVVGTRYDDTHVIELPGDSVIGAEDLEGLDSRPPALFDEVSCEKSTAALQQEMDEASQPPAHGAGGGR